MVVKWTEYRLLSLLVNGRPSAQIKHEFQVHNIQCSQEELLDVLLIRHCLTSSEIFQADQTANQDKSRARLELVKIKQEIAEIKELGPRTQNRRSDPTAKRGF